MPNIGDAPDPEGPSYPPGTVWGNTGPGSQGWVVPGAGESIGMPPGTVWGQTGDKSFGWVVPGSVFTKPGSNLLAPEPAGGTAAWQRYQQVKNNLLPGQFLVGDNGDFKAVGGFGSTDNIPKPLARAAPTTDMSAFKDFQVAGKPGFYDVRAAYAVGRVPLADIRAAFGANAADAAEATNKEIRLFYDNMRKNIPDSKMPGLREFSQRALSEGVVQAAEHYNLAGGQYGDPKILDKYRTTQNGQIGYLVADALADGVNRSMFTALGFTDAEIDKSVRDKNALQSALPAPDISGPYQSLAETKAKYEQWAKRKSTTKQTVEELNDSVRGNMPAGIIIPGKVVGSVEPSYSESDAAFLDASTARFQRDNTQLPDGTWVTKSNLALLPSDLQELAKTSGYAPLMAEIDKRNAEAVKENKPTEGPTSVGVFLDAYMADKGWNEANIPAGVYRGGLPLIGVNSKELMRYNADLDAAKTEYVKRFGSSAFAESGVASLLESVGLAAAKTAQPGGNLAKGEMPTDVSLPEWIQTGVAATLLAAPVLVPKLAPFVPQKGKVTIPTTEGDITVWEGLSVAGKPVVGKGISRLAMGDIGPARWQIGGGDIAIPDAAKIVAGYKPEALLDTKVFVNPVQLKASGFSDAEIGKLTTTLKDRNLFAGQRSPYLSKSVLVEPTARLDAPEIDVLAKQITKYADKVDGVDLLYGSATIKSQLTPELRGWRDVHDWDIQTRMSPEDTMKWTEETLSKLKQLSGNTEYQISPGKTLIEKKIDGKWEHIADIHSKEISPGASEPVSKIDTTGARSYGRDVAEPSIKVKIDGVGTLNIMTLSESGVRKADTILRVRGGKFYPPERGVAHAGIPKDVADFYVILRTFKGEKIANEFAASWHLTPEELMGTAVKNPPRLGYRLTPSSARVASGAVASVVIPTSIAVAISPRLARKIESPVVLKASSGQRITSGSIGQLLAGSPSVAAYTGYRVVPMSASVGIRPQSPSAKQSSQSRPLGSVPTAKSSSAGYVVATQPSPSRGNLPSGSPPRGTPPSPPPAKPPYTRIPPVPVVPKLPSLPTKPPYPVKPSKVIIPPPVIKPPDKEKPPPPPPPLFPPTSDTPKSGRVTIESGSLAWRQGIFWKFIPPPWNKKPQSLKQAPIGAVKTGRTPKETVQMIGRPQSVVPQEKRVELGFETVLISNYGQSISFVRNAKSRRRVTYSVRQRPTHKTKRTRTHTGLSGAKWYEL